MAKDQQPAEEEVVRLAPLKDTLRELYLKSGNRCAFPGCREVMIDADGDFIGQIVHIEAAEKGGERFNKDMTNEQRRHFSNLMLMCYPHHVKTNDIVTYTVEALKKMKADHEAKFTDIAKTIEDRVTDHGLKLVPGKVTTLNKFNDTMKWGKDGEELASNIKAMRWLSSRLHRLPQKTRQILAIIVNRIERYGNNKNPDYYRYDDNVVFTEIAEATNLPRNELIEHVEIMNKYGLAEIYQTDEEFRPRIVKIRIREYPEGGNFLTEIREFCRRSKTLLTAIIEELRFDMLD